MILNKTLKLKWDNKIILIYPMKSLFNLIILCGVVYLLNAQFLPSYTTPKNLYTGAAQGMITTPTAVSIPVTFGAAGFTISTDPSRKPFIGVCSIQKFNIENQEGFYFWTKVLSFTATSFTIQIQDYLRIPGGTFGFVVNFIVKFRYIIVSSTFPSVYMSRQIYISASAGVPKIMTANDVYSQNFTISTLAPSTYTNFPLDNDTNFLYSLSDITVNLTAATNDNSFGLRFNFTVPSVTSPTQFTLRVINRYSASISRLGLMVFVYNKASLESSMRVRVEFEPIVFVNLLSASFLMDYFSTKAWQDANLLYYGFTGFDLSKQASVGFQLILTNLSPTSPNYSLRLNNLVGGAVIPKIQASAGLVTELKCPVQSGWTNYFLWDSDGKCYATCPFTEFTPPSQIGATGILQCKACIATCASCSFINSNCTSCFPSQNRYLSGFTCLPNPGFYQNNFPTAPACSFPCQNCFNISTNCTSCSTNYFLTVSGGILTCINCNNYDPMCQTCNSLKCITCGMGYMVDVTGGCSICTDYHPMCLMCDAAKCTACGVGFYLNGVSCSPCTNFHPQCTQCTLAACTSCSMGYMANAVGTCVSCLDFHTQCTGCTPSKCTTCTMGFFPNGFSCTPCTNYAPQCTKCTNWQCTQCLAPSILSVSGNCISCLTFHPQCVLCNPSGCVSCAVGSYLIGGTCMSCTNFHPLCNQCTDAVCTSCSGGFMVSNIGSCITCANYHPQCTSCTVSECSTCAVGFYASSLTCAPCSNYHNQCQNCSPTACTLCNTGFYITPSGSCVTCSDFHPNCLTCTGSTCTLCTPDHALNATGCRACSSISVQCDTCNPSGTCLTCNPGFILSSNTCLTCASLFGNKCQTCDPTQCTSCISGYLLTGAQCIYLAGVCGDGQWNELAEECDDGNFDPNDGCDPNCKAEEGFVCLYADKLVSGASLCKYNSNMTVEYSTTMKQRSSNTLHIFFSIKPSIFKDWTQTTINLLLSPIEIINQQTSEIIPFKSINISFSKLKSTEQIEITLTYDQLIQGCSLRYNIIPSNTAIPYIAHLQAKNNLSVKLNSGKTGMGFYNFGEDIYQFEKPVTSLSTIVGLIALVIVFVGLCFPAGKLIIVEGIAVLQVSFFSLLIFSKIPPSYFGFKSLIYANGYNDPNLLSSTNSSTELSVYDLIGIQKLIFSNYNFSFIIFFLVPFLIGLIGNLLSKRMKKDQVHPENQQKNTFLPKDDKPETKISKNVKQNIWIMTFKRIMYENAFYGMLVCGYLAWVSLFYGLSNSFNGLNVLGAFIVILVWLGYVVLFCKVDSGLTNISEENSNDLNIQKGFAEFRDVFQQVSKTQSNQQPASQRIYIIMMVERVLISAIITLASSLLPMPNLFIIGVYVILIFGLVIMFKKSQSSLAQKQRKGLFSHIYKNYALRQMINFVMIVLIQFVLCYSQMQINSVKVTQDLTNSEQFTGITAPTIFLALMIVSLCLTLFFWIWQVANDKVIPKGNHLFRLLFSIPQPQQFSPLTKQIMDNIQESSAKPIDTKRSASDENKDEFESIVNEYVQNSQMFGIRNSPFIGAEEKETRKKMIEVLKLKNDKDGNKLQNTTIAQMAVSEEMDSKKFDQI